MQKGGGIGNIEHPTLNAEHGTGGGKAFGKGGAWKAEVRTKSGEVKASKFEPSTSNIECRRREMGTLGCEVSFKHQAPYHIDRKS